MKKAEERPGKILKPLFSTTREKLIEVMEVLDLVPARPSAMCSELIRIEQKKNRLKLSLSSEISCYVYLTGTGDWPFEETVYLDRRLLAPFIFAAKTIKSKAPFLWRATDKQELFITNGSRKLRMSCSAATSGYQSFNGSSGKSIEVEPTLTRMMVSARHCSDQEQSTPEISCVYAKQDGREIILYATTGVITFKARVKTKLRLHPSLPFPLYSLGIFENEKLRSIETTDKEVVLSFSCGKVWQSIAVKAAKKFPYKQIDSQIKLQRKKARQAFIVDSKHFASIVDRLTGYLSSVRRLDWVLTLKGKKQPEKYMELLVTIGTNTFREKLHLRKACSFDFTVDWPLDRIVEVIQSMAAKDVDSVVSFDKENRSYLQCGDIDLLIPRRTK